MKKFFSIMIAFVAMFTMSAQTVQPSTFFDNTEISVKGGVSSLMHPNCNGYENLGHTMQGTVGVGVTKWVTPSFGLGVEGTFGIKNGSKFGEFQSGNWFNYVTVMPQLKFNLGNLFCGYNGEPRTFEFIPTVGIGWVHGFYASQSTQNAYTGEVLNTPYNNDKNDIGGKLAFEVRLNMTKRLALTATPYVAYNFTNERPSTNEFTNPTAQPRFDARNAWYGVEVGVAYRFGNTFKLCPYTYTQEDVDALNEQINELRARKPEVIEKEVIKEVVKKEYIGLDEVIITFEKESSGLTDIAKAVLNKIIEYSTVVTYIQGDASYDGNAKFNENLANARAESVKKYLEDKGVKVISADGKMTGSRIATIYVK